MDPCLSNRSQVIICVGTQSSKLWISLLVIPNIEPLYSNRGKAKVGKVIGNVNKQGIYTFASIKSLVPQICAVQKGSGSGVARAKARLIKINTTITFSTCVPNLGKWIVRVSFRGHLPPLALVCPPWTC